MNNYIPMFMSFVGIGVFLFAIMYAFVINPVKTEKVKIVKKSSADFGKLWKITVESNGKIIEYDTKYYVYSIVSEGDEGTIYYRDNFCIRFIKN